MADPSVDPFAVPSVDHPSVDQLEGNSIGPFGLAVHAVVAHNFDSGVVAED